MAEDMIDMNALEEQMKDVNAKFEEFRKVTQETSKKVFHAAVAAFFKTYPEVYALRWTQYTPYFNDGDTCEFSVGTPCFYSKKALEDEVEDDYEYSSWEPPSDYEYKHKDVYADTIERYETLKKELGPRINEIQEGIRQFSKLFNSVNDDTMLSLFGDHVRVTVTATGIDIEEYDHE